MSTTRPWVDAFADEMESKLAANRHKGDREGWAAASPGELLACLIHEVSELAHTLPRYPRCGCREAGCDHVLSQGIWRSDVRSECADIANFAMMVADVAGGLHPAALEQRHKEEP